MIVRIEVTQDNHVIPLEAVRLHYQKGLTLLKVNNLFYFIPNSKLLLHFC